MMYAHYIGQPFEFVIQHTPEVYLYSRPKESKEDMKRYQKLKKQRKKEQKQLVSPFKNGNNAPAPLLLTPSRQAENFDSNSSEKSLGDETSSSSSEDSEEEREVHFKKVEVEESQSHLMSEKRTKMSKSYLKAMKKSRHKMVIDWSENPYEGYSQRLLCNKTDTQIQDLFMVSAQAEKKLKRLQDLKRAKLQLLEYEQFNQINLNYKQKV